MDQTYFQMIARYAKPSRCLAQCEERRRRNEDEEEHPRGERRSGGAGWGGDGRRGQAARAQGGEGSGFKLGEAKISAKGKIETKTETTDSTITKKQDPQDMLAGRRIVVHPGLSRTQQLGSKTR